MLNTSQLAQQYATALACPITNGSNSATALLTAAQSPISLSTLQQQQQQQQHHHHHHHRHAAHATSTSPYILLSTAASTSDEVCVNGGSADLTSGLITGKTNLSSPSTFYFYNHNSTPTIYPTDLLRL
jgi:hypothetical protein